jgi:hypothetical protein
MKLRIERGYVYVNAKQAVVGEVQQQAIGSARGERTSNSQVILVRVRHPGLILRILSQHRWQIHTAPVPGPLRGYPTRRLINGRYGAEQVRTRKRLAIDRGRGRRVGRYGEGAQVERWCTTIRTYHGCREVGSRG